ncbi:MAG TPA: thiamine pyrophosphate-requiring protein [Xanthobacteraceae bacterium]|nr:thiamine pyrophosphate-requiring protein [Xanthobacteraceae bacterium]
MATSVARKANVPEFTTAYYLLEGLHEIGIDYLFCNFGTDHAPIIDEMAHRRRRGEPMPAVVRCPHENTAAHMAAGYALVTGRGQGVLVHVDVGTANTANGMHNLFRSRLPVLLMAGKAPYTINDELVGSRDTYVHFVQEPFDQASLVRPYLKWEWTLPSGVVVKEALRRAASVMQSEPRGPVYLMMQRETLTQPWNADEIRRYPADRFAATSGGGADPQLVAALAEKLVAADNPILITGYAGRHADASRAIDALAQFAGIAVYEANMTNNISHDSPCFVGFSADQAVPEADVGLLVDVDVPWFPSAVQPNETAFWAHIDIDILKPGSPMWTFPGNMRMQGDSGRILDQVREAVKAKATPRFKATAAARLARIKVARDERIARAAKLAADKGKPGGINPHYLMAELGKLLDDEDILFNEGVTNAAAVLMQIPRRLPNTTVRAGGGGLGWSGGEALGAKLAAPDRLMVQICGDGGFYFGNPSSVFAVAQQYKLPILSIVMDNSGWNAVKQSTLRVYPDGEAKAANAFEAELAPNVHFTKIGEAFGAYAEEVGDPADVPAALARCVKAVRAGRAALLHARVTKL